MNKLSSSSLVILTPKRSRPQPQSSPSSLSIKTSLKNIFTRKRTASTSSPINFTANQVNEGQFENPISPLPPSPLLSTPPQQHRLKQDHHNEACRLQTKKKRPPQLSLKPANTFTTSSTEQQKEVKETEEVVLCQSPLESPTSTLSPPSPATIHRHLDYTDINSNKISSQQRKQILENLPPEYQDAIYQSLVAESRPLRKPLPLSVVLRVLDSGWKSHGVYCDPPLSCYNGDCADDDDDDDESTTDNDGSSSSSGSSSLIDMFQ